MEVPAMTAADSNVETNCVLFFSFDAENWQQSMAARLGLAHTLRPLGRPKKASKPTK
jgi:hypothetical protein